MVDWLYFVQSNREYHDLMSFLLGEEGFSGIDYLVFNEDVRSIDGGVFHTFSGYLLAVNFLSHISEIEARLDSVGLNPNSLVNLYDIVCKDDTLLTKAITITESAKGITFDKDLKKFVADKHFKFSDGSALTIPLICRRRRL